MMNNLVYDKKTNTFYQNDNLMNGIPQIIWHITDRCFLACPYCFATKTARQTPIEDVPTIVSKFKKMNVQKVDIAGGDPLAYRDLSSLCHELKENGMGMTLTTSGVGLPQVKQWLVSNVEIFDWILLSLDAPNPELHDKLRGKDKTFIQLINLFNDLKNREYHNIRINTVVTTALMKEGLVEEFVKLIRDLSPAEWCLIEPHPANQKDDFSQYVIERSELLTLMDRFEKELSDSDIKVSRRLNENYSKYWVLYPNGVLRQHTEGKEDRFNIAFLNESPEEIYEKINENGIWVPERGY
ncbi:MULTISPECIES: radical SAM protein [Lysinibacillus]|uniref:radical SAM protein n=1 Tax=Lysinibacillus TaxID=400634 RepID=UPI000B1BEE9C|nr:MULTISPECIES: radical SAM protein [Lysinibacillus]